VVRGEQEQDAATAHIELLDCLDPAVEPDDRQEESALHVAQGVVLLSTLKESGVRGNLPAITPGPVYTRFEFQPERGVTISQLRPLVPKLQENLQGQRVLLESPIPGKTTVGFDILNMQRRRVGLRELLQATSPSGRQSGSVFPVGVGVTGEVFTIDLATHPHVFIEGGIGAGKSALLHTVVASVLCQASPLDVRFMMIDPGLLQLPLYSPLPHMIGPVVTDSDSATRELRRAVSIMDARAAELSELGIRHYSDYASVARENHLCPKPRVLVMVDNLALLSGCLETVQELLAQLTLHGDRVGIHVLVTTDPPLSRKIATWVREDFSTLIALSGADSLFPHECAQTHTLGIGDMLLTQPGFALPYLLHGAWISESACERLVRWWATKYLAALLSGHAEDAAVQARLITERGVLAALYNKGTPDIRNRIEQLRAALPASSVDYLMSLRYHEVLPEESPQVQAEQNWVIEECRERDKKLAEAARIVVRRREASVSMLQRRLNTGWAQAGRVIDQLEEVGVVGPYIGSKSRKVLVDSEAELDRLLAEKGIEIPREHRAKSWLASLLSLGRSRDDHA